MGLNGLRGGVLEVGIPLLCRRPISVSAFWVVLWSGPSVSSLHLLPKVAHHPPPPGISSMHARSCQPLAPALDAISRQRLMGSARFCRPTVSAYDDVRVSNTARQADPGPSERVPLQTIKMAATTHPASRILCIMFPRRRVTNQA